MTNEFSGPAEQCGGARGRIRALFGSAAIWIALAAGGYPFPFIDDPPYIGAGLNLAAGGGLVNPLMETLHLHYYEYTPLHSYLIAGWLKAFGISAASMVALFTLCATIATYCTIRVFQKLNREFLGWMAALSLVTYLTSVGMRPDAFGLFFSALSFHAGLAERRPVRYLAPLFAILGLGCLPASLALMGPWLIYLLATQKRMWLPFLVSGAGVALLCCVLINWDIHGFLFHFLGNKSVSNDIQSVWIEHHWYTPMGAVKIVYPILGVGLVVILKSARKGPDLFDALMVLSVLLGLYAIWNTVSGHRIMGLVTVIVIGYYIGLLIAKPRPYHLLVAANSLLIIGSGLRPMVQGITTERTPNGPQLLSQVNALNPSRIIVDEWSLRYVFNYRLRPGMVAVGYSARLAADEIHLTVKYPDECWVLSAESVEHYHAIPHGLPLPRYVSIFGKPLGRWLSNAGEIGISPPGK